MDLQRDSALPRQEVVLAQGHGFGHVVATGGGDAEIKE